MKTTKLSLSKMLKDSKIDFIKLSKYFLGTLGILLISAIIIISVIGIKLGFDYTGGTVVEAVYDVDTDGGLFGEVYDYNEEDAKDIVETAISGFDLKVSSYQTEESSFGNRVIFKLTSGTALTETQLGDLKESLFNMFATYDESDEIQSQYVKVYNVEGFATNLAVYASIALSVGLILLALWVFIRYGISQALALLITSIINILAVFIFVIISRTTVDTAFIASIFTTFVLTFIGSLVFFDKIKENQKNADYKVFNKNNHSNLALREIFNTLFLILGVSLIAFILISGLGVAPIRNFGLPALFGAIVSSLSIFFAVPYFWIIITFKNKIK